MPRAKQPEVAAVERRDLGFIQSFDDGQDGSVHEADVRIGVTVADVADSPIVLTKHVLDGEGAGCDVIQEGDENTWMQPLLNPIVHFDQHRRWHDQWLRSCLD